MQRLFFWGESDAHEADFVRGGFAVRPWSRSALCLGRLRRVGGDRDAGRGNWETQRTISRPRQKDAGVLCGQEGGDEGEGAVIVQRAVLATWGTATGVFVVFALFRFFFWEIFE
jgi:hypothetical protein